MLKTLFAAAFLCAVSTFAQQASQRKADYPLINSQIKNIRGVIKKGPFTPSIAGRIPTDSCEFAFQLAPGEKALEARGKSPVRLNRQGGCEMDMEVSIFPACWPGTVL